MNWVSPSNGADFSDLFVEYTDELRAASVVDQNPSQLDTPITINFGPAKSGTNNRITLAADGVISVVESGTYRISFNAQYGRTGASGTSWLYFRRLIAFDGTNFIQAGQTILTKLSNANEDLSLQLSDSLQLTAGWKIKVELMRGSEGNNSGGLIATTPAEGTWDVSPSAGLVIKQITIEE